MSSYSDMPLPYVVGLLLQILQRHWVAKSTINVSADVFTLSKLKGTIEIVLFKWFKGSKIAAKTFKGISVSHNHNVIQHSRNTIMHSCKPAT